MIPSFRIQAARASAAGWRPMTATVLPAIRHSFMRAGAGSTRRVLLSVKRTYATEAFATAEDLSEKLPAQSSEGADDISDSKPLFSSLQGKVHRNTLKALTQDPFQYEHMSVVQAEVLPLLPELSMPRAGNPSSRDLLVKARTGTGKTIAFLVPAIEARIRQLEEVAPNASEAKVQQQFAHDNVGALVISPTRELASQIVTEAHKLTKHHRGFHVPMMIGGLGKYEQVRDFNRGRKDILVATPGRLKDMLQDPNSGVARALKNTKMLILDEADTLLDMGFRDDIEDIMRYLPDKTIRQTLLFSATVSDAIQQISNRHLSENHKFVNCVSQDTSEVHDHIPQYHTIVSNPKYQLPHLLRLVFQDQLEHGEKSKVIIFLPTTKLTQLVGTLFYSMGRTALPNTRTTTFEIHSKKTMPARTRASDGFRAARGSSILVTSDVSARGVDYPGVTRVIQLGLPSQPQQYVHRIGRTGRGGSTIGRGDLVLHPWEYEYVKRNFSHLPLKPLTVTDLHNEVKASVAPKEIDARPHPASLKLADLEQNIMETTSRLDPATVGDTMMSLIGFYASITKDLRMSVTQLVEELGKWTVEGLGLSQAPYVSQSFLNKIGGGGSRGPRGSSGGFGQKREWRDDRGSSGPGSSSEGKPWLNSRFKPRDSSSFGERENRFRPRDGGEGGFRPRDGGFKPREDREGGFKFRPREAREGGFKPREFRPREDREGGFKPREGGFRPREDREGGFKPREGGFRPRPEGGFKPRGNREGGFGGRSFHEDRQTRRPEGRDD
ncbi:DEAD-domain-containing protein [Coprinopsis marcescibilis]|uniref:ATP-dependent RNA helicase n=1 Tax=Coprinopsis marcescibilis TaxID=230819 RepID=A0A5C3L665_COPMA|nr:DEAD-domain-containing protein [Coprinopsis marcescibilis]